MWLVMKEPGMYYIDDLLILHWTPVKAIAKKFNNYQDAEIVASKYPGAIVIPA